MRSILIFSVSLAASSFHITLVYAQYWTGSPSKPLVMSQITLIDPPLQIKFAMNAEKIYTFSNERENKLTCQNGHATFHTALTFNYLTSIVYIFCCSN